jgi:membrane-associated PAP2 superfamily phosphatase/signal transduction histidine kinase
MSPDRAPALRWWSTRVVLPVLGLAGLSIALGRSRFDHASLEPFYDAKLNGFPMREDWFFQGVLHVGGKYAVIVCAAALAIAAAVGWRRPSWKARSRRFAYLVACLLATVAIAGAWKAAARQVTPWDTLGFGGEKPWPGSPGQGALSELIGSPGAHAASGFAWMSLFFVGASRRTRFRWIWLAPGLLLGLLFALGQHARGAHQPSHEPWSIAIAWVVAAVLAVAFRAAGWLDWREYDDARAAPPVGHEGALAWMIGSSVAFAGVAFFAADLFIQQLEWKYPGFHRWFEALELSVMALGLGIAAWLLTDKILSMRAREEQRVEQEREQRFRVLGRMAASVAHEVRNPLQTVRLIVDEQRHEVAGLRDHPLQPEFESCLERIDRAVDLVYRLARPEGGEADSADLAQAARESIVALGRITGGRVGFEWVHEPPRAIVASSRSALRIVIDNLLRNAVEASPAGENVQLELSARNAHWALCIKNRGSLGRPRAQGSRPDAGLGLGVPISRQIASNAGGSIDIVESDGHVTCTLTWPRAEAPTS